MNQEQKKKKKYHDSEQKSVQELFQNGKDKALNKYGERVTLKQ